jgi:hypothetical protein
MINLVPLTRMIAGLKLATTFTAKMRDRLKPLYSAIGRPSVDPAL